MVKVNKINNEKIKIDGIEISIKEYNKSKGLYESDKIAIDEEYQKAADEVGFIQSKVKPGTTNEYYTTEEYLREIEKSKKVNWNLYQELKRLKDEKIYPAEREYVFWRIFSESEGYSYTDDEEKMERNIKHNNEGLEKLLSVYQEITPKLKQLVTQREKTNNEWGNEWNDPNKDKSQEELGQRAKEIEAYRNKVKGEIETALSQDPQITNEELDYSNRDWENEIWNSNNALGEKEIDNIKERVLTDISTKRTAKQAQKNKDGNDYNEYDKLTDEIKNKALKEITKALESSWLSSSDLSADCQNWREQIELAAQEQSVVKIGDIQNKVLADIQNKRGQKEEKENQAGKEKLENIRNSEVSEMTDKELAEALKLLQRWEGESEYDQVRKEKDEIIKQKLKTNNFELYQKNSLEALQERMIDFQIDEEIKQDLSEETQKLLNGEISDKNEIEAAIDQAIKEIGEVGSKSRWRKWIERAKNYITNKAHNSAQYLEDQLKLIKQDLNNLKNKINYNSYIKESYQQYESEVQSLEAKLNGTFHNNQTNDNSSAKWIITASLFGVVILGAIAIVVAKKRKKNQKQD